MVTSSEGGRTYSDPSYGSIKTFQFSFTAGTRATAIIDTFRPMNQISILDWNMSNSALGTGGACSFVLAATSGSGTAALGTIAWTGTHAAGVVVDGTATETVVAKGGAVHLYSVLATAADLKLTAYVTYREDFDLADN